MDIFIEAGFFAIIAAAAFVVGLVLMVRNPKEALKTATVIAPVTLALALVGAGMGQRLVDRAIIDVPDTREKVVILSAGTREAQGNQLLGGAMALILLGLGAAMTRVSRTDA